MIRGSVLLAACVGLWSCSSDSTASEAGVPDKIVSLPSVVFVTQDSSELVAFQLVDALDGQIPTDWTIGATPPEFTVTFDSTFRPIYNPDGTLTLPGQQTEARATITGVSPGAASFTVSASGKSLDIQVKVLPNNLPATFSTLTPNIGENLVVTMPAGLKLRSTSTFSFAGAADPVVIDIAADGSTATLQVAPGTDSKMVVTGVAPDFAPAASLSLQTTDVITATDVSDYVGTDAIATAPTIALPGVGGTVEWYDIPATSPQYYKFVVADTTTLKTTILWADDTGDIDVAWYNGITEAFLGYFGAGSSNYPEVSTHQFAPGTYAIGPEVYAGGPGAWYNFKIEVVSKP